MEPTTHTRKTPQRPKPRYTAEDLANNPKLRSWYRGETNPKLLEWYRGLDPKAKARLARKLGMTVAYLSKAMSAGDWWNHERAVLIEYFSKGHLTREEVLPEANWKLIRRRSFKAQAGAAQDNDD